MSRPGFLSRGVTEADLKRVGNYPWLKDKFARWAIRSEKTKGHDLRSDVKSMEEDFKDGVLRILKTSAEVTGGRENRVEPTSGGSGNTKNGESLQS